MSRYEENSARNADIRRLRREGLFPRAISKQLGLTRNAVIGVLNRSGLCDGAVDRSAAMRIAVADGKPSLKGEHHPRAKLTEAAVRAIRRRYVAGDLINGGTALAREFGVKQSAIWEVVNRVTWKHVA